MRRLLQVLAALGLALVLTGCGDDGDTQPDPGEGGGGTGGGTPECSEEDPFDPAQCPTTYPDYECVAYVDGDVDASGDGWSWPNAVKSVQAGIDLARCGALNAGACEHWQVWVKQGSYYTHQVCQLDTVRLRPNVGVYGGFTGTETTVLDRDWESNETILDGGDGPSEDANRVHHVVAGSDDAILDGFTIQRGLANDEFDPFFQSGAGMGNLSSSPTVENCTFRGNEAVQAGAGMVNYDGSSPTITNCTFVENETGGSGGAVFNDLDSSPAITDCTFLNNLAGMHGGGVASGDGTLTISSSTFDGNGAREQGGAVNTESGTITVTDCTFLGNTARNGGALRFSASEATIAGCTFTDNQAHLRESAGGSAGAIKFGGGTEGTVSDCTFVGNSAGNWGGAVLVENASTVSVSSSTFDTNVADITGAGIMVFESSIVVDSSEFLRNNATGGGGLGVLDSTADVSHCSFRDNTAQTNGGGLMTGGGATVNVASSLFHGNSASLGGAIEAVSAGPLSLLNCTMTGNEATTAGGAIANAADLTVTNSILWDNTPDQVVNSGTAALAVTYSDVQGGGFAGTGNIDLAPDFVDLTGGDLHLQAGSPCIDVANGSVAPAMDLDGNPRVGPADMGAYEYQP